MSLETSLKFQQLNTPEYLKQIIKSYQTDFHTLQYNKSHNVKLYADILSMLRIFLSTNKL